MIQTPISFALDILLDCETIEEAHKKCRKYIKILEAMGNQPARQPVPHTPPAAQISTQAPSTQRLLEQHGIAQPAAPMIAAPLMRIPQGEIDKETGRPMVATGNGTKGPKKW